jgi:hypothetical protein
VNCSDDAIFRIGEKNWNAIGSLYGEQESWRSSDERIAAQRFGWRGINRVNDVGMKLPERHHFHAGGSEGFREAETILFNTRPNVPIGKAKIQNSRGNFPRGIRSRERACAAGSRAESVREPLLFTERRRLKDRDAPGLANRPMSIQICRARSVCAAAFPAGCLRAAVSAGGCHDFMLSRWEAAARARFPL